MSASFCPQCGAKLLPDAKFCSKCGTTIENKPAEAQTQVPTSGFCAKCGSPLLVGAVCCSKCGADVGQPAAPVQPDTQQPPAQTQNIRAQAAQIRSAAAQLGRLTNAPAMGGEFSLDIPDPMGAVTQAVGRRFGIANVLAGLAAGGASFAAIWNFDSPVKLSVIISVLAVVLRIMLSLIRRLRK